MCNYLHSARHMERALKKKERIYAMVTFRTTWREQNRLGDGDCNDELPLLIND